MGFTTGLIIGAGIGYVLGAQAGRERYDQLLGTAKDFAARPEVQDLTSKGKALADLAVERARTAKQGVRSSNGEAVDAAEAVSE